MGAGDRSDFQVSYEAEGTRAAEVATLPLPSWSEVEQELWDVLLDVRVVVDNGTPATGSTTTGSTNGELVAETVIAVGGGTLSRGSDS